MTLPDGKRKVLYAKTHRAVASKPSTALGNLERGVRPADQRQTVLDWVTEYVDDMERRGVAHNTIVRKRGILENHLAPALG